jgi:alpha-L-arabinofuranosidase
VEGREREVAPVEFAIVFFSRSQIFADEAVSMIEFARGDASTKYGAIRIALGHPAPFTLTRMEV